MRLHFREVTLKDKEWIDPLLEQEHRGSLEYNFTTTFVWRNIYGFHIARMDDYFPAACRYRQTPPICFRRAAAPLEPVIRALEEDARKAGTPLVFNTVLPEAQGVAGSAVSRQIRVRDLGATARITCTKRKRWRHLRARSSRAKRNHIHRFVDNHPDWQYEPMAPQNILGSRG